uniref:Uncharacterized protein n=1 Tax=Lepeophtheirus salmonis TaxID=72036 RepID=A0A0K2V9A9_LEPSM
MTYATNLTNEVIVGRYS